MKLRERGIDEENLAQVYAPLGLDIGADSPAEIAISALAEIIAVLRSRSASHMRFIPHATGAEGTKRLESRAIRFDGGRAGK